MTKHIKKEDSIEGLFRKPYPLEFLDTSSENVTEDQVLDYLAHIIVDIYFDESYKTPEKGDTAERT